MSDVISPVPSYFCVSLSYLYMGTHLISLSHCNPFFMAIVYPLLQLQEML